MKTGQLFWGFLFLALGAFFLLDKYSTLNFDWHIIFDLWPLILLFIGLSFITKESKIKPLIAISFGIFVGAIIFSFIARVSNHDNHVRIESYSENESFAADYDSHIKDAKLEISAGAGLFIVQSGNSKLIKGFIEGNNIDYKFKQNEYDENSYTVNLDVEDNSFSMIDKNSENRLDLYLHTDPLWDLTFNLGAADSRFDLKNVKVKTLRLDTGASNTTIKLGSKVNKCNVEINMGAAAVELAIPKNSGCKIKGDMFLIAKSLPDYFRESGSYYISNNFEASSQKVYVELNGAMASFKIKRY